METSKTNSSSESPTADVESFINNVMSGENVKAKEILLTIIIKKCSDRLKSVLNN